MQWTHIGNMIIWGSMLECIRIRKKLTVRIWRAFMLLNMCTNGMLILNHLKSFNATISKTYEQNELYPYSHLKSFSCYHEHGQMSLDWHTLTRIRVHSPSFLRDVGSYFAYASCVWFACIYNHTNDFLPRRSAQVGFACEMTKCSIMVMEYGKRMADKSKQHDKRKQHHKRKATRQTFWFPWWAMTSSKPKYPDENEILIISLVAIAILDSPCLYFFVSTCYLF